MVSTYQTAIIQVVNKIGMLAAVVLPFFNIPLILRIRKRRSSEDISLVWVFGVWISLLCLEPAALLSRDLNFKLFSTVNLIFFSLVVFYVVRYKKILRKEA